MEIGLAILLFVCMTALLYVVLSLKITRQVDVQMKEFYKTRIHTDIQEFYREMEGYAGLLEARIKQFKSLVERNEEVVRAHETANAQALPLVPQEESEIEDYAEPDVPVRHMNAAKKKVAPLKKGTKHTEPVRKATAERAGRHAQPKKPVPSPVTAAGKTKTVKPATSAAQPIPVNRMTDARPAVPRVAEQPRPSVVAQQFMPPVQPAYHETDDSAIAEELMKDLFAQDQVKFSAQSAPKKPEAAAAVETAGERTMANFFSRIGKSVGPIVFGEKPAAAEAQKKAELAKQPVAAIGTTKPVADFSEVLRRAEQIKAEKKAERERAEVEARAEFYANGDTMSPTKPGPRMASLAANGDTMSPTKPGPRMASLAANGDTMSPTKPRTTASGETQRQNIVVPRTVTAEPVAARQSLAVKDLDQHTINFLIDSLKQENGYRKQALRALTENNIPLPEIARLSKIDIGELELMRQLGRF